MSNEFVREERYIVFKLSDVERYLTDKDRANITMMKMEIDAGRYCANKPPFKGLIVEDDWPEYEPTWKAIEARVAGAQPTPSDEYVGWYCAHCERGVDASEVTYHEQHQVCGRVITEDKPPKPAPSIPEGWLRAIDDALVSAHVGVANADDTYGQAKAKLDNLIGFHVDVATDPAVNGGWKLVPIEPTEEMIRIATAEYVQASSRRLHPNIAWRRAFQALLAAAPEAKS